jgi:hypothetical protein
MQMLLPVSQMRHVKVMVALVVVEMGANAFSPQLTVPMVSVAVAVVEVMPITVAAIKMHAAVMVAQEP